MKKIALITGATSGIGEACARKFAQGGYDVILTGRNATKLQALQTELTQQGTKVLTLTFDVRDKEAARQAVDSISDEWKPIDVLINNAGLVETNFSVVRFRGDQQRADNVYKGVKPLIGDDIADVCFYVASAPKHVQIAEVTILATHQASPFLIARKL